MTKDEIYIYEQKMKQGCQHCATIDAYNYFFHMHKSNEIKPPKWHIASKPKHYSFTTNRNSL